MTSQEITINKEFNTRGILSINMNTLINLYNETQLTWNGLEYAGGHARDIIIDELGICFICAFKADKAAKTKTGRIKKSEYKNPNCYIIEAQKVENFFKAKYN